MNNRSSGKSRIITRCLLLMIAFRVAGGLAGPQIAAANEPTAPDANKLAFKIDDAGKLAFDTGVVKGSLQKDGAAEALTPISFDNPEVTINNTNHGLLTPYRF